MGKLSPTNDAAVGGGDTLSTREPSRFEIALRGARHYEDMIFPRTSLRLRMRVLTRAENQVVDLETRRYMAARGFEPTLSTAEEYHAEKAMRTLQIACRDAADVSQPVASIVEWRDEADDDQIAALWQAYDDLRQRLDPRPEELSDAELTEMMEYFRKKPPVGSALWRGFGAHKLSLFLRTLANLPPISPTLKSSRSPVSEERTSGA